VGGPWEIVTTNGIVSGFPGYNGTFPTGSPPLLLSFGIYNSGILIPMSLRFAEYDNIYSYRNINLSTNLVVTGGGSSEISVRVHIFTNWGGIRVLSRILHISPLYT
jgi:hypothetical protein